MEDVSAARTLRVWGEKIQREGLHPGNCLFTAIPVVKLVAAHARKSNRADKSAVAVASCPVFGLFFSRLRAFIVALEIFSYGRCTRQDDSAAACQGFGIGDMLDKLKT